MMIKIISPGLHLGSVLMIKIEASGTHRADQKQGGKLVAQRYRQGSSQNGSGRFDEDESKVGARKPIG
jgi:hypothetical protein